MAEKMALTFWSLPTEIQNNIFGYLQLMDCIPLLEIPEFSPLVEQRLMSTSTISIVGLASFAGSTHRCSLSETFEFTNRDMVVHPSDEFETLSKYLSSHELPKKIDTLLIQDQMRIPDEEEAKHEDIDLYYEEIGKKLFDDIAKWESNFMNIGLTSDAEFVFPFSKGDILKISTNGNPSDHYSDVKSVAPEIAEAFYEMASSAQVSSFKKDSLSMVVSSDADVDIFELWMTVYKGIFGIEDDAEVFANLKTLIITNEAALMEEPCPVDLSFISDCKNLDLLTLYGGDSEFIEALVTHIDGLPKLKTLVLAKIELSSFEPKSLSLINININSCVVESVDLKNVPKLKVFTFAENLTSCTIKNLGPNLTDLSLSEGGEPMLAEDDEQVEIVLDLPSTTSYEFMNLLVISTKVLNGIAKPLEELFPNLTTLMLSSKSVLTEEGEQKNAQDLNVSEFDNCAKLSILGLSGLDLLSTELDFTKLSNLKTVSFTGCKLYWEKMNLPRYVKLLNFSGSHIVSEEGVAVVPPHVQHFNFSSSVIHGGLVFDEGSLLQTVFFAQGYITGDMESMLEKVQFLESIIDFDPDFDYELFAAFDKRSPIFKNFKGVLAQSYNPECPRITNGETIDFVLKQTFGLTKTDKLLCCDFKIGAESIQEMIEKGVEVPSELSDFVVKAQEYQEEDPY